MGERRHGILRVNNTDVVKGQGKTKNYEDGGNQESKNTDKCLKNRRGGVTLQVIFSLY